MMLRQMEYFVAIYDNGNFTKAAEILHVSQPSITVAIQNLERELNTILMNRSKGEIELTESGLIFYEFAKKTINELDRIKRVIDDLNDFKVNVIKIDSVPNMGVEKIFSISKSYSMSHNIDVYFNTLNGSLEVIQNIEQNKTILGFAHIDNKIKSRFNTIPTQNLQIYVLMNKNHHFKDEEFVSLEMLKNEKIGMYKNGSTYCEQRISEEYAIKGILPKIEFISEQYSIIYNMIAMGYCIGFSPDPTSNIIKNNSNIIIKPLDKLISFQVGLVWKKDIVLPQYITDFLYYIKSITTAKEITFSEI